MCSYQSTISLILLLTKIVHSTSTILKTHCQIISDRDFQPSNSHSLISTIQLFSSSSRNFLDCAHICLKKRRCRTAVFESQQRTCALYSESATSSGSLVVNSTGHFSTIITDRPTDSLIVVPTNVTVFPIWNTTAGQNSVPATAGTGVGQYWYEHSPKNVFDGNWSIPFCSYGAVVSSTNSALGGLNTGVYLTLPGDRVLLEGFRFVRSGSTPSNDPWKLTIEGSNFNGSALTLGSSWTLIYNGTTGFDGLPDNNQAGIKQTLHTNLLSFSSYRFLMTANRVSTTCISYTEIELYQF